MKNYISSVFGLTAMVAVMVFGLRYVPEDIVAHAHLKPIDIIADLNRGNTVEALDQLDAEAGADIEQPEPKVKKRKKESDYLQFIIDTYKSSDEKSTTPPAPDAEIVVEQRADSILTGEMHSIPTKDSLPAKSTEPVESEELAEYIDTTKVAEFMEPIAIQREGVIPIVDYSADGSMLKIFMNRLKGVRGMNRPIRVGFMGDSFIEGDILTNDFREMMQTKYGGGGVGFVPITSQVAGFRQTVGHKFEDWESSSLLRNKSGVFTISAFSYTPEENSSVEYKGSGNKKHLSSFKQARMLFISLGRSVIRATVNGNQEYLFNTEPSEGLQEFVIEGNINTIKYTVTDVEGLTVYGAFLDDNTGVCVDNFAVRSNSGALMARVNLGLSRQFRQLAPYDLIVLQYGLNVASKDVLQYSSYQKQMQTVVNHMKRCFPNAAILVMSVGDRGTRVNENVVTMSGITAMVRTQEQVARDCGVLFWNTYDAMIADGGIGTFVENGWAAKDYTHLSARGGKKIATALYDAITVAAGE